MYYLNKVNTHLTVFCPRLSPPPSPSFPASLLLFCLFYLLSLPISCSLSPSSPPLPPPSPSFPLSLSQLIPALAASPSPLPLLAELQSRWVFSGCYDLRDDNGSYNVASCSWCGWACGGFCCVRVGDWVWEGGGNEGGTRALSQPQSRVYLIFFFIFFSSFLSFSPHPPTFASTVVFLQW